MERQVKPAQEFHSEDSCLYSVRNQKSTLSFLGFFFVTSGNSGGAANTKRRHPPQPQSVHPAAT